ncbi:carbohydrate ABC transporter permease [Cohnella cholangitidis]|nr:sugar ABC transporter permease [Cohnella cholangitidis]
MHTRKWQREAYYFFLPGFLFICLFLIYPLVQNFVYSFFDFRLTRLEEKSFIGFDHYVSIVNDSLFWITLRNLLYYGLLTVPGQMVLGFLVAYALFRSFPGVKVFRAVYFLPVITSWVVASLVFKFIFTDQGFLNYVLTDKLHWTSSPVTWLSSPFLALTVLGILGIWKGVGWVMVLYLAALQNVPRDLFDAAKVDGAGAWQRMIHITLPSVRSTTQFIQVMLIIGAFNVFTSVVLITNGGPLHETEVLLSWMYNKAFHHYDLGFAAALAYLFALPIALLNWLQMRWRAGE